MQPPTASDIRTASRVNFADPDLGYPPPTPPAVDPLQEVVDQALSYITYVTGRPYDPAVALPPLLEPIMRQAARMRTEQIVQEGKSDNVETAGDFDMLSGFTAGPYSETRRGMADADEAKAGMLNPWPALNRILWLLLGLAPGEVNDAVDERRDYWRYMLGLAPNAPAWQVIEVDWRDNQIFGNTLPPGFGPVLPVEWPYGY